jgi:hypothetical protein
MFVHVRDFVDVAARARGFGYRAPVRIALLPGNFSAAATAEEFRYHAATPHVRSAWWSVGLEDEGPEARGTTYIRSRSANPELCPKPVRPDRARVEPDAPSARVPLAVFFGVRLLDGPDSRLAVALGMVSSVLAFQPGCAGPGEVRLDTIVERPGDGCVCLEYRGDAYGVVALTGDVRGILAGR